MRPLLLACALTLLATAPLVAAEPAVGLEPGGYCVVLALGYLPPVDVDLHHCGIPATGPIVPPGTPLP